MKVIGFAKNRPDVEVKDFKEAEEIMRKWWSEDYPNTEPRSMDDMQTYYCCKDEENCLCQKMLEALK